MIISVKAGDFARDVKKVRGAIEHRNTIPILTNVAIEASKDLVTLRGSDLDIEIKISVAAEVTQPGDTTVHAQRLHDFIDKLPRDSVVEIKEKKNENKLTIKSGRSVCSLHTLPTSDFPDLGKIETTHKFSVPSGDLRKLLGRVKFAISTEETRYYLNGIYLHSHEGSSGNLVLRTVATDGHRLAMADVPLPNGADHMPGVIVPRKTVGIVHPLIGEDPVVVEMSAAKIIFECEGVRITSKLIDGSFPDYARVIPTGNNAVAILARADFSNSVERVATISEEDKKRLKLRFMLGKLEISTLSGAGTASDEMEIDYNGPEAQEIGFNPKFIAEVLREVRGDKCKVSMSDAGSPAIFQNVEDLSTLFVIMPMRAGPGS